MSELSDPGALVLGLFARLVDKIKSARPVKADGSDLTVGFVYSQVVLGVMIDPRDFKNPWSPAAGVSPAAAANAYASATGAPAPPVPPPSGPLPTADNKFKNGFQAALNTSRLVDKMIMVTNDGSYLEYPTSRSLSFTYGTFLDGMTALPSPPLPADVLQRLDEARKLLFQRDDDGNFLPLKTPLYQAYFSADQKYQQARKEFTDAFARQSVDPVAAATWPVDSVVLQQKVDDTYETWRALSADKIEAALATVDSIGVPFEQQVIHKAREKFKNWSISLTGIADTTMYASILPSEWCDPNVDDIGWQDLAITSTEARSSGATAAGSGYWDTWQAHSSSTSGGGSIGFAAWSVHAEGAAHGENAASSDRAWSWSNGSFHNDAKNLSIELEYGLCTVERPWLMGDVFYAKHWVLTGERKNSVSDGTVNRLSQENTLLPMIPTQFLAIRNVKIKSTNWGEDGQAWANFYSQAQGGSSESDSYVSGGGGYSLGFVNFGGRAAHSEFDAQSAASGSRSESTSRDYGWRFDGETLEVRGTQIIAWLSEIVPACPSQDA
jgi:hypothetical protein